MNLLKIEHLNKKYPKFELKDVNISLDEGYIMGFIGRNGAGKTTTIKSILNLTSYDSGKIELFERDSKLFELENKQKIAFMFGDVEYYKHKKIRDITKVTRIFYDEWSDQEYQKYIEIFELDEDKRIKELSAGMKVKYLLTLAMSHNPKLLILDEPTSGLDPVSRDEVLEIFQQLVLEHQCSILFSTQIVSDLEKCADYITYIKKGRIIKSSDKEDFIDSYRFVTGDKTLLAKEDEKSFISYKLNDYGFTGLCLKENADKLSKFEIKQADIETIMIYCERENYAKLNKETNDNEEFN